jgi:predicted  nucleic acid-binding Zn-ribbon protein
MAIHARSQIRNAVRAAIIDADTDAAEKVYDTRVYDLANTSLPAVTIRSNSDQVEGISLSKPRTQQRSVELVVTCFVKGTNNYATNLDTLCEQVETVMANNTILSGASKDVKLNATDMEFDANGKEPVAIADMSFTIKYSIKENEPNVSL